MNQRLISLSVGVLILFGALLFLSWGGGDDRPTAGIGTTTRPPRRSFPYTNNTSPHSVLKVWLRKQRIFVPIEHIQGIVPEEKIAQGRGNLQYNLLGHHHRGGLRKTYFDLGARQYKQGSFHWMEKHYPEFRNFSAFHLFDVLDLKSDYARASQNFRNFHFVNKAAWVHDGGVTVKGLRMGHVMDDTVSASPDDTRPEWRIASVDFSAYLKRHATASDFVVVKVDIEGGEWVLLDHLYATGALRYIDELFLECHGLATLRMSQECVDLINGLRTAGVYAHQWI